MVEGRDLRSGTGDCGGKTGMWTPNFDELAWPLSHLQTEGLIVTTRIGTPNRRNSGGESVPSTARGPRLGATIAFGWKLEDLTLYASRLLVSWNIVAMFHLSYCKWIVGPKALDPSAELRVSAIERDAFHR